MSINKLIEKMTEEEKQKAIEVIALCKSPEELIEKAKKAGYKLSAKDAKEFLADFAAKALANAKMAESEHENVAGGCGCGNCDHCSDCGNC